MFTLRDSDDKVAGFASDSSFYSLKTGTFMLYDGDDYTGKTVNMDLSAPVTLEYYTVKYSITNNLNTSCSTIGAKYKGFSTSFANVAFYSGGVAPKGREVVVTAAGKGAPAGVEYLYEWTDAPEEAVITNSVLTIPNLSSKANVTCTVSAPDYQVKLTPVGTHPFDDSVYGYSAPSPLSVTVKVESLVLAMLPIATLDSVNALPSAPLSVTDSVPVALPPVFFTVTESGVGAL